MDHSLSVRNFPTDIVFVKSLTIWTFCFLHLCSLDVKLERILGELGVELVEDLDTIFQGDEGLLLAIRAQLAAPDVEAFIRKYHQYKELVNDDSTADASSTSGYTFDNASCSIISSHGSSGVKRKSAEERLKEQKEAKITRRIEGTPYFSACQCHCSPSDFQICFSAGEKAQGSCDSGPFDHAGLHRVHGRIHQ